MGNLCLWSIDNLNLFLFIFIIRLLCYIDNVQIVKHFVTLSVKWLYKYILLTYFISFVMLLTNTLIKMQQNAIGTQL